MEWQENSRLTVQDLHIEFQTSSAVVHAVRGVSLEVQRGRISALVGESGSGKSVTSLAVMGLLPPNGKITKGDIRVGDQSLCQMGKRQRQRWNGILTGMIFQDPTASLNPLYTVGDQMMEGILRARRMSRGEAVRETMSYLEAVHLPDAQTLLKKYPFELSGGMCQRVMIAATMALCPLFLIADEPTTALDVTVQSQILSLLYHISREKKMGILFITHDLGVVAEIADYVYIMKDGIIVEEADVDTIFHAPRHDYTKLLLDAIL